MSRMYINAVVLWADKINYRLFTCRPLWATCKKYNYAKFRGCDDWGGIQIFGSNVNPYISVTASTSMSWNNFGRAPPIRTSRSHGTETIGQRERAVLFLKQCYFNWSSAVDSNLRCRCYFLSIISFTSVVCVSNKPKCVKKFTYSRVLFSNIQ